MQFNLVGYSHYSFTNDQGKLVEGFKFHVVRPSASPNFHGHEACSLSVSEKLVQECGDPKVGTTYSVQYDQRGRIASYKALPART